MHRRRADELVRKLTKSSALHFTLHTVLEHKYFLFSRQLIYHSAYSGQNQPPSLLRAGPVKPADFLDFTFHVFIRRIEDCIKGSAKRRYDRVKHLERRICLSFFNTCDMTGGELCQLCQPLLCVAPLLFGPPLTALHPLLKHHSA